MTKRFFFHFLLCSVLTLLSDSISASPQMPDYIVYRNDTIVTYNLLVEEYLQHHEVNRSDQLFGLSFREGASFNCWRGYQAIYKINNDSLFLFEIIGCGELRGSSIDTTASSQRMKAIFKDKVVDGKVYIDWFSGDISFPLNISDNKVLRWDGVFYKIYEQETVINISSGKVQNIASVSNYEEDPQAIDRKDKSKLSNILFKQLKKVAWESIDKYDCSDKYLVTIGKNGEVSNVMMPEYPTQDSIDKYWDREEFNYCINNVLKALRKLKFDIIKDKGKPIAEEVYLEIWFDSRRKIKNWTN